MQTEELYNLINLAFPLHIFDLRPAADFTAEHLRDSKNIAFEDFDNFRAAAETAILTRHFTEFRLILIVNEAKAVSHLVDQMMGLKANNQDPWTKVKLVAIIEFDQFFADYGGCTYLFTGSKSVYSSLKFSRKSYPTSIIPNRLYLGDYEDGKDPHVLTGLGISRIIDATGVASSKASAESLNIKYYDLNIWDSADEDIAVHFQSCFSFLEEVCAGADSAAVATGAEVATGGTDGDATAATIVAVVPCIPVERAIVHCRAGISRSATVVIAYLMHISRAGGSVLTLKDAVTVVQSKRPHICPNEGFRAQLRAYEQHLLHSQSFSDDEDMMTHIRSLSNCWTGAFAVETDFDRIPVLSNRGLDPEVLKDEFPDPAVAESIAAKPKKPFLRRAAK